MQATGLPERIEPDAIIEALVEFRLEHTDLPELMLGRLLDLAVWEGFAQTRLPTADIPQPIRDADLQLRYQPLVELRRGDGARTAKIGSHVISYHVNGNYPGWGEFRKEISEVLADGLPKLRPPQLSRLGFRYINVFRPEKHHIRGLADTNVRVTVGEEELTSPTMVQYMRVHDHHTVTVRIATPEFVAGNLPSGYTLLCDIDVATKDGAFISTYDQAMRWIEGAHTLEKAEFFTLLPAHITTMLNPESGSSVNE